MQSNKEGAYKLEVNGCSYVIVGDGNTINATGPEAAGEDVEEALKILPTMSNLPGQPFHKCLTRENEVQQMKLKFQSMEKQNNLTGLYLIGPPGSGKTQLARQFGEQFLNVTPSHDGNPPVVLTINVGSIETFFESLKELLRQLKLLKTVDVAMEGHDEIIRLIRSYMEDLRKLLKSYRGKWLLIFDNVFRNTDVDAEMPQAGCSTWGEGNFIVTSQDSDLAPACHEYAKVHSLKSGLNEPDAVHLLQEISGVGADEYAVKLSRELEGFPLSLACAATYVGQMRTDRPSCSFSWKQFLGLYQKQKGSIKFRTFQAFNVYPHSMVVASRLAASRLAGCSNVLRHAFEFLSYCTLAPVPIVIISNFVEANLSSDEISTDEIKAEISRCSLLVSAPCVFESVESIRFHQVMKAAFVHVRESRTSALYNEVKEKRNEFVLLLRNLQESLEQAIPDYDGSTVVLKVLTSPHLKSIVDFAQSQGWTECPEFVVVLAFLADCLYHVSGVTEEERVRYAELAHHIARGLPFPMNNIRYAQVLKILGFYYREAHHLDKAVAVLEEGIRLTENDLGKESVGLRSCLLGTLSWTCKLQMKLDLAEQTMVESIKLAKIAFGENHQELVDRLCNFAIIFREQQNIEKAKEIVDQARCTAEIATDEWNLTRAQAANFSAKIYLRYAEMTENSDKKHELLLNSLKLHADALMIYKKVLGKNHIYIAGVSMTYAMVHKELKNYDQAMKLVERAIKIYEDVENVELSAALRYKVELLLSLGNASHDAEKVIKRSIELCDCGRARFLLSHVYLQQERYQESMTIIEDVLARWKSGVLPRNHFWVKQAEQIKKRCDLEICKMYLPRVFVLIVVVVAVVCGYWCTR